MASKPLNSANLTVFQKGLLLVLVPLVFECFFVSTLIGLRHQAEVEERALQASKHISETASFLHDRLIAIGQRMLFITVTGKSQSETLDEQIEKTRKALDEFQELVKDSPTQRKNAARLREAGYDLIDLMENLREDARSGGMQQALQQGGYRTELTEEMREFNVAITAVVAEEQKHQNPAAGIQARRVADLAIPIGILLQISLAILLLLFFSREISARLQVIIANSGRLARAEALLPDLTGADEIAVVDRNFHAMANALAEAKRKERELERLRQEFVAMVSHDLRTPLTSVQLFLASLGEGVYGEVSDKIKSRADISEKSLERLIVLVNSLLDLEKLEAGKMQIDRAPCDMGKIIAQAVNAVESFAASHQVTVKVEGAPMEIKGDEHRLVQVVVNLLSNAIKFSPEGGCVTVAGLVKEQSCQVTISDQGRGVPLAYQQTIFDRFQQVAKEDETDKGGTGLGLPICKAIVEAHDGQIGVDSDGKSGSTFWFTIPLT